MSYVKLEESWRDILLTLNVFATLSIQLLLLIVEEEIPSDWILAVSFLENPNVFSGSSTSSKTDPTLTFIWLSVVNPE